MLEEALVQEITVSSEQQDFISILLSLLLPELQYEVMGLELVVKHEMIKITKTTTDVPMIEVKWRTDGFEMEEHPLLKMYAQNVLTGIFLIEQPLLKLECLPIVEMELLSQMKSVMMETTLMGMGVHLTAYKLTQTGYDNTAQA